MVAPLVTSPFAEHFWDACKRQRLEFQRCSGCGAVRYPPRRICPRCMSRDFDWTISQGLGTVYSFAIVNRPPRAEFTEVPYVVALVDLPMYLNKPPDPSH